MCIAVPMRVVEVAGLTAQCVDGRGAAAAVDVALIAPPAPGDHLLVHAGVALRALDAEEARLIADALEAAARAEAGLPFEHLFADLIGREPTLPAHLKAEGGPS